LKFSIGNSWLRFYLIVWDRVGCKVNRHVISIDNFRCCLRLFFIVLVVFGFLCLLCEVFFAFLLKLEKVFVV
jgi:hypothetical protein